MCRILAYLGKKPIAIGDLLDKPENSLLNQSRKVHAGTMELNADGVGINLVNVSIEEDICITPAIKTSKVMSEHAKFDASKISTNHELTGGCSEEFSEFFFIRSIKLSYGNIANV